MAEYHAIVYSAVLSLIYELAAIAYAATKFDVFLTGTVIQVIN